MEAFPAQNASRLARCNALTILTKRNERETIKVRRHVVAGYVRASVWHTSKTKLMISEFIRLYFKVETSWL